jgi:hypothetical protein
MKILHPAHILRFLTLIATVCLLANCTSTRHPDVPKGSLHQIGFVWLKNAGSATDRQKVIEAVHTFEREIPEVTSAFVGQTDGIGGPFSETGYDVAFILTFADDAARLRYNAHPVHVEAAQKVFLPLSKKLLFYRFVGE